MFTGEEKHEERLLSVPRKCIRGTQKKVEDKTFLIPFSASPNVTHGTVTKCRRRPTCISPESVDAPLMCEEDLFFALLEGATTTTTPLGSEDIDEGNHVSRLKGGRLNSLAVPM